jgi:hypothetical protein
MVGVIGVQNNRRYSSLIDHLLTEKGNYKPVTLCVSWIPCYIRKTPYHPPLTWLENFNTHFSDLRCFSDLNLKANFLCWRNDVSRMRIFFDLTNIPINEEIINIPINEEIINSVQTVEMLQLFVEKGYNVQTKFYDQTLILKLCKYPSPCNSETRENRRKMVRYLLSIDPTIITHIDYSGWSCLHHAVFNSDVELCSILLSQQNPCIDVNAQQRHMCHKMEYLPGTTALHIATYNRNNKCDENQHIIQMLIHAGIDIELKNDKLQTAVEFGSMKEYGLGDYLNQYLYRPPDLPGDLSTAGVRYLDSIKSAFENPLFSLLA